jgi:hypothetical protein
MSPFEDSLIPVYPLARWFLDKENPGWHASGNTATYFMADHRLAYQCYTSTDIKQHSPQQAQDDCLVNTKSAKLAQPCSLIVTSSALSRIPVLIVRHRPWIFRTFTTSTCILSTAKPWITKPTSRYPRRTPAKTLLGHISCPRSLFRRRHTKNSRFVLFSLHATAKAFNFD